ncbi:glycosylphosphatidylinositol anchor biosynthesis [Diatrype stigma]|uniref:Mannosyltransferase n=1 Tax=Diatrype stigma TaxID=117547 RepID=A0AAN9U9H1_9PEZI
MASSKKAVEKKTPDVSGKPGAGRDRGPQVDATSTAMAAARQTQEALAVIFAWRLINALCVRTFFQPDEYFQALEPAWQLVYGDGSGSWLTWEWINGLRSSLHPAIFALGYYIVDNAIESPTKVKAKWLIAAPEVMQTGFAALGDWYTWRLGERLYGQNSTVAWSVLLGTREDGNTESKYSSAPLFSTTAKVNDLRLSLVLAALAVLLRPTNALIWLAIGTLMLTRLTLDGKSPLTRETLFVLFRESLLCGSFALGLSLLADRQYYGEWTFPPFTFMRFNVLHDLAVFYGENDWHYYLSQGIPLLCTTITPFALKGLYKTADPETSSVEPVTSANALKALTFVVSTTISSLSFVSHKEVRFITPLLPILHILAAPHVTSFFTTALETSGTSSPRALGWKKKPLLLAGILVNAIIGGYLSYFHAAAPISVVTFLRTEFENVHPQHLKIPRPAISASQDIPNELFALFLTPCHATPWRSHLVYPALRARALTCDPPIDTVPGSSERKEYQSETDRFYEDPVNFLKRELWPGGAPGEDMARYIVGFEGIEGAIKEYFDPSGPGRRHRIQLKEVWSSWNGLFTDDDRKAGRLVVWATGFYDDEIDYVGML